MNIPCFPLCRARLRLAVLLSSVLVSGAWAAPSISEDWSAYSIDAAPGSPWTVSLTEGATMTVQDRKGSNQLYVSDPTGNAVATLSQSFTATTEPLDISFSFDFVSLGAAGGQLFRLRDSSSRIAIEFSFNSMSYRPAGGGSNVYIPGFGTGSAGSDPRMAVNTRYTVTFTNISTVTGTYGIAYSASDGGSGSLSGLSFYNAAVNNLAQVQIGTGNGAISSYYLDNITVGAAIPEPATASLVLVVAAMGVAAVKRRKS